MSAVRFTGYVSRDGTEQSPRQADGHSLLFFHLRRRPDPV
ncbi:hypothetical protein ACPOL_6345 [Acidisarcina polymorpha]|uniref:Uncharacterized protein n=1 Tax=Acidisarcina polymorpha TaxID=2211140 RepID=A0A2Z5G995_9BACT|nr:hypothetical protein ACPOL_6345 [Acidisarcina polymorpha]